MTTSGITLLLALGVALSGPVVAPLASGTAGAPLRPAAALACTANSGLPHPSGSLRHAPFLLAQGRGHTNPQARVDLYLEVEALADERLAADPEDLEARWWRIAAMGLRVDEESARGKIGLAREIHGEARWILEREPDHAGGHHAMGRLHAGVLRVNRVVRFLALRLVGEAELRDASWEGAVDHLRRAVEAEPCFLSHRFELARALMDQGREEEARGELALMLALEDRNPMDPVVRRTALDLWGPGVQDQTSAPEQSGAHGR